ncbi:MAG: hypothetical protein M3454_01440 [Actinomycetota bacterium]|nr:hypothetical protein [Actinomycetota bacterium]
MPPALSPEVEKTPSSETRGAIASPLRHLDPAEVGAASRIETRNREVHLPPVSVYRWWARRTETINGAIVDAISRDRPGRLLISDPFSGGGVIPLAIAARKHRVYAQDLNPWAAHGLTTMLGLPRAEVLEQAAERLAKLIAPTVKAAYATELSDGTPALLSHTFRVPVGTCSACGHRERLFPHALVSLRVRKERGQREAFIACSAGHIFEGLSETIQSCPECDRPTDPKAVLTKQRVAECSSCGCRESLEDRVEKGAWTWEVVLVERAAGRRRELALPSEEELRRADDVQWKPARELGAIPAGQETRVLLRHGYKNWEDLYPRRQRVVLERLLALAPEATDDAATLRALQLAIVGASEMAGQISRWDRLYLKSYESMAGHRFNFTTFAAEPNVWGTPASGRGTVSRRLKVFSKASTWLHARALRDLSVQGPLDADREAVAPFPTGVDVLAVQGSSERMLLPTGSVDLVLTDPPYHDDVQYGELSLPLRAWAGLPTNDLVAEASVNPANGQNASGDDYEDLLAMIFDESRRTLSPEGHLIFSYANRSPAAWVAVFGALERAGLRAVGYQLLHSENETDYAKRDVRACTLDLIMDLVPQGELPVDKWEPSTLPNTAEGAYLAAVAETFLGIGDLSRRRAWRGDLTARLRSSAFLSQA